MQNLKRKHTLPWETKNMLPQAIARLCCQKAPSCLAILTREYDDEQDISRCTKLVKMTEIKHQNQLLFQTTILIRNAQKGKKSFPCHLVTERSRKGFPRSFRQGMTALCDNFFFFPQGGVHDICLEIPHLWEVWHVHSG